MAIRLYYTVSFLIQNLLIKPRVLIFTAVAIPNMRSLAQNRILFTTVIPSSRGCLARRPVMLNFTATGLIYPKDKILRLLITLSFSLAGRLTKCIPAISYGTL